MEHEEFQHRENPPKGNYGKNPTKLYPVARDKD